MTKTSRLDAFIEQPRRALWQLSVPVMAGMGLQTAYMLADMYFVGQVSAEALAALAFNMPLVFLGLGVVFGLGTGVTAVIARYIGARDKRLADSSAEHAVALGLLLSILFTVVALLWGRPLLAALGVPASLMSLAWDYFSVIAMGYVFVVMSVFFRSILSGEGDTKTPMMIQGAGTLLNIALDPVFIFSLGLGVKGAAWATVLSQAVPALVFVYFLFFRDHAYVNFELENFRPSASLFVDIFRIGAPASFSFIVIAIGGAVFNRLLIEYSEETVAAFQVGMRIDHIVLLPIVAISASTLTLTGMFSGASRIDLVRGTVIYALSRAIGVALAMGTLFFVLAPSLVGVFSESPRITEIGTGYLRVAVFGYPFVAMVMLVGRVLQGMGQGSPMFVLSLLRVVLLSGPLAYLFVFHLHKPVEWVWLAMVGGMVATAFLAAVWLKSALGAGLASSVVSGRLDGVAGRRP
ncbi:MAG TPA: MATE family efflux transporter [Vicinamibacteria bacterium]|nr:MATE family efflux transporter [Vicinamibacteria bacterium]